MSCTADGPRGDLGCQCDVSIQQRCMSSFYVLGIVQGVRDLSVNKMDKILELTGLKF